jgi:hypothetical protein
MGFRDRIKAKLKEKAQDMRALVRVVSEEAKHPGRPQPHMVARNPLWGGEAGPDPTQSTVESNSEEPVSVEPLKREEVPQTDKLTQESEKEKTKEAEDDNDFWYLRGDDEGWSDLNPGDT